MKTRVGYSEGIRTYYINEVNTCTFYVSLIWLLVTHITPRQLQGQSREISPRPAPLSRFHITPRQLHG